MWSQGCSRGNILIIHRYDQTRWKQTLLTKNKSPMWFTFTPRACMWASHVHSTILLTIWAEDYKERTRFNTQLRQTLHHHPTYLARPINTATNMNHHLPPPRSSFPTSLHRQRHLFDSKKRKKKKKKGERRTYIPYHRRIPYSHPTTHPMVWCNLFKSKALPAPTCINTSYTLHSFIHLSPLMLTLSNQWEKYVHAVGGEHDMGRKRCGVVWIYYLMTSERLFVVAADNIRWIMWRLLR